MMSAVPTFGKCKSAVHQISETSASTHTGFSMSTDNTKFYSKHMVSAYTPGLSSDTGKTERTENQSEPKRATMTDMEKHAVLSAWSTRLQSQCVSKLANSFSSHAFPLALTTKEIDAFCTLAHGVTRGKGASTIGANRAGQMVLGVMVQTDSAQDNSGNTSACKSKKRPCGTDDLERQADAALATYQKKAPPKTISLAKEAIVRILAMRGPDRESIIEQCGISYEIDLTPPKFTIVARFCCGVPIDISQLRTACGGECWADGSFRVARGEHLRNMNKALPSNPIGNLAVRKGLLPLAMGISVPIRE